MDSKEPTEPTEPLETSEPTQRTEAAATQAPSPSSPSTALLTDKVAIGTIRAFNRAAKPSWVTPLDVCIVVHLMTRKAEDHAVTDSQQTLADHFGATLSTVARSIRRLDKHRWVIAERRRGASSLLSLNIDRVPGEESTKLVVSPEARAMVNWYLGVLGKRPFNIRQFPKGFAARQLVSERLEVRRRLGEPVISGFYQDRLE